MKAAVALPNFLIAVDPKYNRGYGDEVIENGMITPGLWREDPEVINNVLPTAADGEEEINIRAWSQEFRDILEKFKRFFSTIGSVHWQDKIVDDDGHVECY